MAIVFVSTAVAYACKWEPEPTPAPDCALDGSGVVGDLPIATQADYAPGLAAAGVVINPGTYLVNGVAKDDAGNQYYRILLSCQYLYVPVGSMQPSYQAPQSGEPLPTNEVS
jgi:hypothetical protein